MTKGIHIENRRIYQDAKMITDNNPIYLSGGLISGNLEMLQQIKDLKAAAIAKGLPVRQNITPTLVKEYTPQVENLMSKGWDTLFRSDGLAQLKAMNEGAFNEVFKQKFGYYPNQKPKKG